MKYEWSYQMSIYTPVVNVDQCKKTRIHLSVIMSKNVEIDQNMFCQLQFGIICQLSVRMLRSKQDLSVQIWNHLSVVSDDDNIKT